MIDPGSVPLLEVVGLRTVFETGEGDFAAVDGVDFSVEAGRTLAIVGESGCGKSVTSLSIMGLLPEVGRIDAGTIRFDGVDLRALDAAAMRRLRGNRIAMIFQEPMTSLNPAFTIGEQIVEALLCHRDIDARAARRRAIEALERVRMPAASQRIDDYPHKLSGGMRQRAMIAMALACEPALLIADEPTTALDVTIQAQILALMDELQRETGMAIVLITHDLGVVAEMADEVAVMYAGRVIERAPADRLFEEPQHPYTVGLLGAMPRLDTAPGGAAVGAAPAPVPALAPTPATRARLATIDGQVPGAGRRFAGCRFESRCPFADADCRRGEPSLAGIAPGHLSACLKAPLDADRLVPAAAAIAARAGR